MRVTPQIAANNADCVYRFAVAGLGIARLNEFIVAAALRDGRLVRVLDDFKSDEALAMRLIYTPERHRLPRRPRCWIPGGHLREPPVAGGRLGGLTVWPHGVTVVSPAPRDSPWRTPLR